MLQMNAAYLWQNLNVYFDLDVKELEWEKTTKETKREDFRAAVRKWEMLAATKVKISGSERKKVIRITYDISSIKRVTRKFHVVVVQTNGKEVYKKVCWTFFR